MDPPSDAMQLTGSAEHKALVMVIERLDAVEASIDALRAIAERMSDPLNDVAILDPLLQVRRLWMLHATVDQPLFRTPWEGQPRHEGLYEVEADMSCPEVQARLKRKGIQLYRRKYDLLKCQLSHQTFYGSPEHMPTSAPDKWYVSFTDRIPPKDEVSTWERVA